MASKMASCIFCKIIKGKFTSYRPKVTFQLLCKLRKLTLYNRRDPML